MIPQSSDTMVDAIALSSPSGRMSKRARRAAEERLRVALFGKNGMPYPKSPQVLESVRLREHAKRLLGLAQHGMNPNKFRREAQKALIAAENLAKEGH